MQSTDQTRARSTSSGHLLVRQIETAGIRRVYSVPGESFLDVLDGLYDSAITNVVARCEGGAGFMALAEGRLTDLPGVAVVTRGPGAANAFIAVHTAYQDATPLILFVGLIPVSDRERESFQEFDIHAWFGSTTKKVVTLETPDSAAEIVADAIHTSLSGRPGPVVIGLPEDILTQSVGSATVVPDRALPAVRPAAEEADAVCARLAGSERPLMIVGGEGWTQQTGEALARWAAAAGIPVASDFRAYDAVPHTLSAGDSFVGSLGYSRSDRLAAAFDAADVLLFIGCTRTDVLSDGYTIGLAAHTIVAAPGSLLGHFGRLDQHIAADPGRFVEALTATVPTERKQEWLSDLRTSFEKFSTPRPRQTVFVDLNTCMSDISELVGDDAIITYGAGNHALWPARYLTHTHANSLVAPRNGAMGVGIPAAVAAGLIFRERTVISVAGDGCFMMNGQEIATAIQYGSVFVAIVVDNGVFATIREHQERRYPDRPSGTALENPDFAALVRAYGGHGETVEHTNEFRPALQRALDSGTVALIHVRQDSSERSLDTSLPSLS